MPDETPPPDPTTPVDAASGASSGGQAEPASPASPPGDELVPTASDATAPDDAADDAPPAPPEPNPVHEELNARLRAAGFDGDAVLETADVYGNLVVRVATAEWRRAGEVAKAALECDYLSFIAGIDWQPAPARRRR